MEIPKNRQIAKIKLSYRSKVPVMDRPLLKEPKECYQLFLQHWDMDMIELHEQVKVIFLDISCRAIGIYELATGGTHHSIIDVKLIMAAGINANASQLILAHNHPSGSLLPSKFDKVTTQRIVEAGKLLDIEVIDHIIITRQGYYSFAASGAL